MSVATQDVLDWLSHALATHNDHPDRRGVQPVAYPSALPERERWIPLVRAVLESEEGVLVDATTCGRGVACGNLELDAPLLIAEIERILVEFNRSEQGSDLRLELIAGRAIVVGSQDYESVNAAQRALREVLAAVCADDLRSSELSALVYAEDALDEQWVRRIWQLLMQLPALLDLGTSATMLIVPGDGVIDFDTHCGGTPSLRARLVDGGGLLERHAWERSRQPVRALQKYSREKLPLVVLFLGAGASVADGLPTGDALRNQALGRLLGREVDRGNFDAAARHWWRDLATADELSEGELGSGVDEFVSTLTLERVIEHEQREENDTFSTTLREFSRRHEDVFARISEDREAGRLNDDPLAKIVSSQQRIVIVTVNFDRVIEARVGESMVRPFVTESELADLADYLEEYKTNGGPVPLLKVHGDIAQPGTIVANTSQTNAGLSTARDGALTTLLNVLDAQDARFWWYVGYSMRDRDLANTWKSPRVSGLAERWVAPFLDPYVERFIEKHRLLVWERDGRKSTPMKHLISLTAHDYFQVLYDDVVSRW